MVFVLFLSCLFFSNVILYTSSMYSNKSMEGYPMGYLSDCPLPQKEPRITQKSLKRLAFVLQGAGDVTTAKRTRFNYYQMKALGKSPKMDYNKKTVIYVGGFMDSPGFVFSRTIAVLYKKMDFNVLSLDTNYFTTMQYPLAALYTRVVGRHTAEMLGNLTRYGLDPKKLEIIGLSLGAQTISFIAKHFYRLTGMKISRITGLDPAGPCFRNLGPEDRLDETDADFVDTINTNIDWFGMAAPVGHVNFYVNGGEYQPGDFIWMPCNVLCSHLRSYTLWLSSLQHQNSFIAMQCSSIQEARQKNCYDKVPQITNVVGPKTDRTKHGIFFLATDNNFPYYLGKKGLKKEYEYFSRKMKSLVESHNMTM